MHVLEQEPELVEPVLRALEADVDKRIELLPSLQKGVGALALILPETSDLLATILAALEIPHRDQLLERLGILLSLFFELGEDVIADVIERGVRCERGGVRFSGDRLDVGLERVVRFVKLRGQRGVDLEGVGGDFALGAQPVCRERLELTGDQRHRVRPERCAWEVGLWRELEQVLDRRDRQSQPVRQAVDIESKLVVVVFEVRQKFLT